MASDETLALRFDLLNADTAGLRVSGAQLQTDNFAVDNRFPRVDDILDRLTLNTKAA